MRTPRTVPVHYCTTPHPCEIQLACAGECGVGPWAEPCPHVIVGAVGVGGYSSMSYCGLRATQIRGVCMWAVCGAGGIYSLLTDATPIFSHARSQRAS